MRLLRAIAVVLLVGGVATLKLACHAGVHVDASVGDSHVSVNAEAGVVGYAAMDEVPVTSGELRLVVPVVMEFADEHAAVPQRREMINFPLQRTNITAKAGGMMSVFEIEQVFANPFSDPIEAVYAFPLGAHGAVSGYEIAVGDRKIKGEIHTTRDARQIYDDAKSRGYTAGIVEQVKPNLFLQRVTNIAPGETVTVKMTFVEMLEYRDGEYEMVVPLTVGPRYKPAIGISYVDTPQAQNTVGFTAEIDPGMPIVSVDSPSHQMNANAVSPTKTIVQLASDREIPNKDLILRYKTAGTQTQIGLLAHRERGAGEGYFVLSIQPKGTYQAADIIGREVLLVIDRSGSMNGEPLAQAKSVASGIIDTLTPRDKFDIIAFASGVDSMSPVPIDGSSAGKQLGREYLQRMSAGGGTEMAGGVAAMLDRPPGEDRVRVVYFLTDGFVGNDDEVVGAAKRLLGTNRIFTIGVGSAPNRDLLDRLADAGRGYASYLAPGENATNLATTLVARSAYPYLTDIRVDWNGLDVDGQTPKVIPDIYAGQPIVMSGRYREPGSATITVRAHAAGRDVAIPIAVTLPSENSFEPVSSLWARRQIEATDSPEAIEALGLKFHLVTKYTSFVAVDGSRKIGNGIARTVEQPNVMPESSSTSSRSSSDDDSSFSGFGGWGSGGPETDIPWILLLVPLASGLWLVARRYV